MRNGALIQVLRAKSPHSDILVFGERQPREVFIAMARAGSDGYLLWDEVRPTVVHHAVISIVDASLRVGSGPVVDAILRESDDPVESNLGPLTETEVEVLRGLQNGRTEKQISQGAHLSLPTVERAIATLKEKLHAPSLFVLGMRAACIDPVANHLCNYLTQPHQHVEGNPACAPDISGVI
jgi:DNA-binding NarL/FixJ family response regulator